MARQPRLDMHGALNHIRRGGSNRSPIFLHQKEKWNFLNRVREEITEGHCSVKCLGADDITQAIARVEVRRGK